MMINQSDRKAAWPFKPSCYKKSDYDCWIAGYYDHWAIIKAFSAYREAQQERAALIVESNVNKALIPNTLARIAAEIRNQDNA
jgi:hypothetical protein